MYHVDFQSPIHIHFIGIGGISMSGLAKILLDRGFTVSGSDSKASGLTAELTTLGASIQIGQKAENITDDIQLVVYTAAISETNQEFMAAREKGIPMIRRSELLGQMMANHSHAVAVAGTHGKTTTTSMLAQILMDAHTDPTVSVGGMVPVLNGNLRVGRSDIFLTEACEYTNSFLDFFPTIAVILNIEEDHMDFFKDIEDIRHSFRRFASLVPEDGLLVINGSIDRLDDFLKDLPCRIITYDTREGADYTAQNITYDEKVRGTYDLYIHGKKEDTIVLGVTGAHNVSNSLAVIAVARDMGISMDVIKRSLAGFSNAARRFEIKGEIGGVTVIDDYAHHPTEIAATLSTAKKYPHRKLWVVFQPHTYSRTNVFLKDFAKELSAADEVVLADIFAAREKNTIGITSEDLKRELEALDASVHYFQSFDEIENFLLEHCVHGDLLITMGAGDIVLVGEHLLGI